MNVKLSNRNVSAVLIVILSLTLVLSFGCAKEPEWKSLNDEVVQEQNVTMRARDDIPRTKVVPSLAPGETNTKDALTAVELYPGVKAKMYWGKGALVSWATMEPGAKIPEEELTEERIMVVWSGSVEQLIDGKYVPMKQYNKVTNWTNTPQKDFIYLREGAMNGVIAGNKGAEILEIYAPVRADYVEKAGGKMPSKRIVGNYDIVPSCVPNKVLNFYDVQYTNLSDMTANSRIISGRRVQCSFLDVDPGRISPYHNHPEEQLMIVLRGQIDETVMDKTVTMNPGDICYLPGDMVHRGEYSSLGCDILDVFWPPRSDYNEKMNDRLAKYHAIIPQSAKPVLEHDGEVSEPFLNFTEGPSWLNGSLYFSNMWFASDWSAGNPQKSNLIRMGGDGLEIIKKNMQTNGIMPIGNGNLAVCDMFGHRVIEMTPEGKVVRTLASRYNGVRVDGPNDLVIDAKGGIYFTDPQFTPGLEKTQPGKAVYYRQSGGKVIRVVDPGQFGQPNGILLSPDGKTCYINNTRNMPVGNYVAAFDVNEDGTLSNMRNFAKLFVPPGVRDQEAITTGADGMTIDVQGNIYVATLMGLQIFDKNGEFIGIVHLPIRPVSCAFGGENMQTLYCTCATQIYSIKTKVKGLEYPLKK